jgi:hypothetical protein
LIWIIYEILRLIVVCRFVCRGIIIGMSAHVSCRMHVWTKVVAAQVTQPIFTSLQRPQHTIQEHSVCHWHLSSPRGSTEKFILILWQTHQLLISDYILWLKNISLKLVADTQNFYNNCRDLNILHKNIVYVTGTCHLLGLVA